MFHVMLTTLCTLAIGSVTLVPLPVPGPGGNYTITVNGVTHSGTLRKIEGTNYVILDGDYMPGWTWRVIDADGDGAVDDIRISDGGAGKTDLKDAGNSSPGDSGTVHDGNLPYNGSNQAGTWAKQL